MENDSIELQQVTKRFGELQAVDRVSLRIARGAFFSLLGPSGCGKTTLLRMIAGLETPTEGGILINGIDMTGIPAHRRPVNTVFQHYALFPHLSVGQNVAFGLRYQGVPRREQWRMVAEALALVRLEGSENRRPNELSGGMRQRVALARALVLRPQVLLLDEPLGALDQKLRKEMQVELKNLQRRLGITFVFVTHDQEEALTMSDGIAVMNGGRVEQVGESRGVFEHPRTRFVAEFMGAGNFFEARVVNVGSASADPTPIVQAPNGTIHVESPAGFAGQLRCNGQTLSPGQTVRFIVRPEKLDLRASASTIQRELSMAVTIEERIYQGISTVWTVRNTLGDRYIIYEQNDKPFSEHEVLAVGRPAWVCWDWEHGVIVE